MTAQIFVSCVDNGIHQVVSGPAADVESFSEQMEAEGTNVKRLRPSPAYHSSLVEPALDGLEALFTDIAVSPPALPSDQQLDRQDGGARRGAGWGLLATTGTGTGSLPQLRRDSG